MIIPSKLGNWAKLMNKYCSYCSYNKIRDTQGTFHAKMSSIKDGNVMDLTEAEDIKKMWQEYTEELYKKKRSPR